MRFLVLRAYLNLIRFEFYLAGGNFQALYDAVRKYPLGKVPGVSNHSDLEAVESQSGNLPDITARICAAVDMACIWYWKEALCLQRSAATACLLKNYGVRAQMVIGAQQMPFRAHAWVEVNGRVVNDKPYVPEMYAVLDKC